MSFTIVSALKWWQRECPGEIAVHLDDGTLTYAQLWLWAGRIHSICFLLFLGGMDTVTNVLGFTYRQLAQDGALQARLAEHPEAIPKFVEEALRMYGVVSNPRIVAKDCERLGVSFRKGDMLLCVLAMGGRDDRRNGSPDVFDIDRPVKSHVTFSSGPHLCIGHVLARAEIRIMTEEWTKRIPKFRASPGARPRFKLGCVNALESLPLQWSAREGVA